MTLLRVPLILVGLGRVGRTLLRQLIDSRPALTRRLNLHLVVVGLAESRHMLFHPAGLDDDRLLALVEGLKAGQTLLHQERGQIKTDNRSLLDAVLPALTDAPVVVDATASAGMAQDLLYALDCGCRLALANNRPLVGPSLFRRPQRAF
jgi:homoserine dehydrogenase